MQPFPPTSDLLAFVGDCFAQISLDPYAVQFEFDGGTRLVVEECLEHFSPDGSKCRYECDASSGPPLLLHHLLQKRIVSLDREDWSLTFEFEDGAKLVVNSDNINLESGRFEHPDGTLTVF